MLPKGDAQRGGRGTAGTGISGQVVSGPVVSCVSRVVSLQKKRKSGAPRGDRVVSRAAGVKGNLVPDAYFAALAIEVGGEWITTDRDYARFPGLKWRHPFDET